MEDFKKEFTDGEWYLQEYTDAYTNIVRSNRGPGFETYWIMSTGQSTLPNRRADARLIAAAPAMLAALEDCMRYMEQNKCGGYNGHGLEWEKGSAYDKANLAREKALKQRTDNKGPF